MSNFIVLIVLFCISLSSTFSMASDQKEKCKEKLLKLGCDKALLPTTYFNFSNIGCLAIRSGEQDSANETNYSAVALYSFSDAILTMVKKSDSNNCQSAKNIGFLGSMKKVISFGDMILVTTEKSDKTIEKLVIDVDLNISTLVLSKKTSKKSFPNVLTGSQVEIPYY